MDNSLINPATKDKIRAELAQLDAESIEIDGMQWKPSQCYRVDTDPFHILFNTNCPERLKMQVQAIFSKYMKADEDRAS